MNIHTLDTKIYVNILLTLTYTYTHRRHKHHRYTSDIQHSQKPQTHKPSRYTQIRTSYIGTSINYGEQRKLWMHAYYRQGPKGLRYAELAKPYAGQAQALGQAFLWFMCEC